MEVYVAISDFKPPIVDGSQNILEFKKGDEFQIYDSDKTEADWWGARCLKSNNIGYVPSRYMEFHEKRVGKLLPNNYTEQKQASLQRLSDMQNSPDFKSPDTMYEGQDEPEPDYNDEGDGDVVLRDLPKVARPPSNSSDEELIKPKKLPNPCLDSKARMAVHKELLNNYKRGINVLEKPELSKVFSQKRETQKKKEWEEQQKASSKRTSFEMKMEQRANKMKEEEVLTSINEKAEKDRPEYQKVFAKITQKTNGQVK